MSEYLKKEAAGTILMVVVGIIFFVFIAYQMTDREQKQKEREIKRKLELVNWNDLRFDFTHECEKSLNEIGGLQSFLATKKVFTYEEARDLDGYNEPLSVGSVCESLSYDAMEKSFHNEFISVERRYDPSDYDDMENETLRP